MVLTIRQRLAAARANNDAHATFVENIDAAFTEIARDGDPMLPAILADAMDVFFDTDEAWAPNLHGRSAFDDEENWIWEVVA